MSASSRKAIFVGAEPAAAVLSELAAVAHCETTRTHRTVRRAPRPLGVAMVRSMKKTATAARKRPGRRRTPGDAVIAVTLARSLLQQIDRWRRGHGGMTRSEAVRQLVERALGTDPERRVTRKFATTASKLAEGVIDRLADQSATSEEQANRKRRLMEGPRDFRTTRRDSRN